MNANSAPVIAREINYGRGAVNLICEVDTNSPLSGRGGIQIKLAEKKKIVCLKAHILIEAATNRQRHLGVFYDLVFADVSPSISLQTPFLN